jgi:hypothetical protein
VYFSSQYVKLKEAYETFSFVQLLRSRSQAQMEKKEREEYVSLKIPCSGSSHSSEYEDCGFLGCDTMKLGY